MNKAFCFIGGIIFPEFETEVIKKSKVGIQNAPNAFQMAFIEGLRENLPSLDVINLPFIGAYPLNYKSLLSPKTSSFDISFSEKKMIKCYNYRFLNPVFFKLYTRERACYNALKKYCNNNITKDKIYVFVYCTHIPFMKAAIRIKKEFSNVRICLIVTDLPEFKNDVMPRWKKFFLDYDTHVSESIYNSIDCFVLLSEPMADKLIFNGQPYTIIEGLYSTSTQVSSKPKTDAETKTIFYSGTLARRYNIMNLVRSVMAMSDKNVKLLICGNGACKDEIIELSKVDKRIVYLGELPRQKVLQLQVDADLLVNPRTNEGEYTKYSFPSKTMEYLASGTPTILYRLDGIPEEYYKYCFSLTNDSQETLTKEIERVLALSKIERESFGYKAKNFILSNKTAKAQTKKAIELIDAL